METLRKYIRKEIITKSISRIAMEIGIHHRSLYRLMDGKGINGETTIKIMKHFKIRPEEIK